MPLEHAFLLCCPVDSKCSCCRFFNLFFFFQFICFVFLYFFVCFFRGFVLKIYCEKNCSWFVSMISYQWAENGGNKSDFSNQLVPLTCICEGSNKVRGQQFPTRGVRGGAHQGPAGPDHEDGEAGGGADRGG